jgi:glucose/arabinose dehydrogenase
MKINFLYTAQLRKIRPEHLLLILLIIMVSSCSKIDMIIDALRDRDQAPKEVDVKVIADSLVSPLGVIAVPDDNQGISGKSDKSSSDKRLFVIDQIGKIWVIDAQGRKMREPFLDITSKLVALSPNYDERGLLGFALHPEFSRNGRFFVYYTAPPRPGGPQPGSSWNNLSRISEFRVSSLNSNKADMNSERPLIELNDPQSNHNGGTLAFGPDNYLYISIGDGGAANDVAPGHVEDWYPVNAGGNGQDIEANLFGNILRIDVNRGSPYAIPRDNPFVGKPGKDEIYAYGFRNPYRFSFDMGGTHRLFAGDAGQVLYEEIDVVNKGGNYGWNVKEGTHCFNAANNKTELPSCPDVDSLGNRLIDPVIEINNFQNPLGGRATTVIGGNVYRGQSIPQFRGKYIFGTFSQTPPVPNGELFVTSSEGPGLWAYQEISLKSSPNDIGYYLKGFGQDNEGEIYLTVSKVLGPTGMTGRILKLVPVR